jgi:hypothetical protein
MPPVATGLTQTSVKRKVPEPDVVYTTCVSLGPERPVVAVTFFKNLFSELLLLLLLTVVAAQEFAASRVMMVPTRRTGFILIFNLLTRSGRLEDGYILCHLRWPRRAHARCATPFIPP